jgi:nicotinate dehydrogenase subunit A
MQITLTVNARPHTLDVDPQTPLLQVLRDNLGLTGSKIGCAQAQCGSCSVLVDGIEQRSCIMPIEEANERMVVTIEGIGDAAHPDPLQLAFIEEQAAQCGYCVTGMIVAAKSLLAANPDPSDAEIREALAGNLCRCGAHLRMIRAIKRAVRPRNGAHDR